MHLGSFVKEVKWFKSVCFVSSSKSSRYCRQPLLNNLSASISLSFIASGETHHVGTFNMHPKQRSLVLNITLLIGFSVVFTLIDPVPQGFWASYHVFGLLSFGHGVCTSIMTLTAAACVRKNKPYTSGLLKKLKHLNHLYICIHRPKPHLSCITCLWC